MSLSRTLSLDYGLTTKVLYVVGTECTINLYRTAPPSAKFFSFECSKNVHVKPGQCGSKLPLTADSALLLSMSSASQQQEDEKVEIHLYDEKKELVSAKLLLTAVEISLDVDADRDGVVEKNNPNKGSWKWGPEGYGAILLVNCNCESGKRPDCEKRFIIEAELRDLSQMVLRTKGPEELRMGHRLLLHMSAPDAEGVRVFSDKVEEGLYPLVLDSGALTREIDWPTKETIFYVEGAKFTDKDFSGLVYIHVSLVEPGPLETIIFTDTVLFKIAPWIMTPNVQPPQEVFVCSEPDNQKFIQAMKELAQKAGCKINVIPYKENLGDPWIQDEIEFGYIETPRRFFPVVLESPRDRPLQNYPYDELLGPDFGYVTKKPPRTQVCSLDSFGNLDVTPPVTVNGKNYPFGRIIFGGALPFDTKGRNMTGMIQDFLHAQVVQKPIKLFTDWLLVGHVDELLSIVPVKDKKDKRGWRLLLASPNAAYKLFQGLKEAGFGQAKLFEDAPDKGVPRVTVDKLLADKDLRADNDYFQRCIDWNRDLLKNELGLDEGDIVDVPALYKLVEFSKEDRKRGLAYIPGMVNMIVLGNNLGIPKPYGPKVKGQCAFEQEMTKLMGNLGLTCDFIDDFVSYHEEDGEVHCGSNVLRQSFNLKWWDMEM